MKKTLNHYTQECCNAILKTQLDPDGVIGSKSSAVIKELYTKIRMEFNKLGYEWHHMNFLAVRMDDKYTNQFTDWGIITKGESVICFPMSTKPGWSYVKNKQYIAEKKGVAVLKEGNYPNMWVKGKTAWTGKPYLQQKANCIVYRDTDMDEEIDRMLYFSGNFGINYHTWKNFVSTLIQNLSAGCQVDKSDIHDMVWPYIELALECQGGDLDFTLIHNETW